MSVRQFFLSLVAMATTCVALVPAQADVITVFNDRNAFNLAAGVPLSVEDFTPTNHFPITSGLLNSQTSLPFANSPLVPGIILPGVNYSTPVGLGNFFNIDAGGGYTGGFLDGFAPSDRDLTVDFWNTAPGDTRAISAFGFDTRQIGGGTGFDVLISFTSGPDQLFSFSAASGFYGFTSNLTDIKSIVISNQNSSFGFDLDNFTFQSPSAVPEPSGVCLGALGLLGLLARRRR